MQDQQENQWPTMGSVMVLHLFADYPQNLWGPTSSSYRPPKCWPKTGRLPVISPEKIGLLRISKELHFGSANIVNHMHIPPLQGKKNTFIEGKNEHEGCSKWRVHGFSLAESLPRKKWNLCSSHWSQPSSQGMGTPPAGLPFLFNWGFCLLVF